jgi:RHS repeat-associated protein
VVEDRVYLGAEEMYTKRRAGAVVEQTLTEHAGGGLSVDIKLVADGKVIAKPVALRRYAVADHLGSCKLKVDPDGNVIAYEEFHPYGTTSYRAMRSGLDAAANRYRFTGMERDEETGLAQHGARYYAGWLGRWVSADPIGIGDGVNRFAYCRGSPTGSVDLDGSAAVDIQISGRYDRTVAANGDVTTSLELSASVDVFGLPLELTLHARSTQHSTAALRGVRDSADPADRVPAAAHEPEDKTDAWGLPLGFDLAKESAAADKRASLDRLYWINETWAHPQATRPDAVPYGAQPTLTSAGDVLWQLADYETAGDLDNFYDAVGNVVARRAHGLEAPDVDPYDLAGGGKILVAGVFRRVGMPLFVNGRTAKAIHDEYLQYVRPGARERTFRFAWTTRSGLGSRRVDDYKIINGERIGFEANTTPWARMTPEKLSHKLDQVAADFALVKQGNLDRVIWFGTEPLPTTGLGGILRSALEESQIPYWVVPWH